MNGFGSRFGDGMVVFDGAAGNADGPNYVAIGILDRDTARKGNQSVGRIGEPEQNQAIRKASSYTIIPTNTTIIQFYRSD